VETAVVLSDPDARVTGNVGTRGFTAPEVGRGEAYGLNADLFSAGATMRFCTTLQRRLKNTTLTKKKMPAKSETTSRQPQRKLAKRRARNRNH
jgi:serine/threonine protein kinase